MPSKARTKGKMATLIDIPTELLLQIISYTHVDPDSTYNLALVSRRLNSVAMPIYLESLGVQSTDHIKIDLLIGEPAFTDESRRRPPPVNNLNRQNGLHLSALHLSFDILNIQHLEIRFYQPRWNTHYLVWYLRRLAWLIHRLQTLKVLVVSFHDAGSTRREVKRPGIHPGFVSYFSQILETLVQRGCQSLSICQKGPGDHSDMRWLESWVVADEVEATPVERGEKGKLRLLVGHMKNTFSSAFSSQTSKEGKARAKRNPPPLPPPKDFPTAHLRCSLPFAPHPDAILQSLTIEAPFMLVSPIAEKTLHLLHASCYSLRDLTLKQVHLGSEHFDTFFRSFPISNTLTRLKLKKCQGVSCDTLLWLLNRCAGQLETLELDKYAPYLAPHSSTLRFPVLRFLKAPLDWVSHFLQQDSWHFDNTATFVYTSPLPRLTSLVAHCRTEKSDYFTYAQFAPVLDPILALLEPRFQSSLGSGEGRLDICLSIDHNPDEPWQLDCDRTVLHLLSSKGKRSSSPPYQTSLPKSSKKAPLLRNAISHANISGPPPSNNFNEASGQLENWSIVTRLILGTQEPPADRWAANLLIQWVTAFFPAVEEVTLKAPSSTTPGQNLHQDQEYQTKQGVSFISASFTERRMELARYPPAWNKVVVAGVEHDLEFDENWYEKNVTVMGSAARNASA